MSKKTPRPRSSKPTVSRVRNRRFLAIVAGAAAVAVLAVVLALSNTGAPDGDAVAVVNGQRITAQDVEDMQIRYRLFYERDIEFLQALERLISDELLYRAATPDYLVSYDEAQQELEAQLERDGLTLEELKAELRWNGIVYEEYVQTFRRELAIADYLDDVVTVTEEEARERYEELAKIPGIELPSFEDMEYQIIINIKQEKIVRLIKDLEQQADVVRYVNSG